MLTSSTLTEPGPYEYLDPIGAPPQRVDVRRDEAGQLIAFFAAIEGDDEVGEIPVADMAGEFRKAS